MAVSIFRVHPFGNGSGAWSISTGIHSFAAESDIAAEQVVELH